MKLRIEYEVPRHVAPLFVQIPRWNGALNVYRGRPSERPHNPFAESVLWMAIRDAEARRSSAPSRVPGRRWRHELAAA